MNCDIKSLVKIVVIVLLFAPISVIIAAQEGKEWRWSAPAQPPVWLDGEDGKEVDNSQPGARGIPPFGTDTPWPAIAYAVKNKKIDRVAELLREGHDPNWQTSMGLTLLAMATNNDDVETARLLVQAKADLDTDYHEGSTIIANRGDQNGTTVLMQAARAGKLELVKLFIGAGANVNRRNMFRSTALNGAVWSNNPVIVRALLDAGAIVRTEDIDGAQRCVDGHIEPGNSAGNNAIHHAREILRMLQSAPITQKSCMLLARQIKNSDYLAATLIFSGFVIAGGLITYPIMK